MSPNSKETQEQPPMNAKRFVFISVALAIAVFSISSCVLGFAGIRLNIASNSLPPGFYRIVQPGNGSDLLICPTGIAEKVSVEREYRVKSFGCGDGYAPVAQANRSTSGRYRHRERGRSCRQWETPAEFKTIPQGWNRTAHAADPARNLCGTSRYGLGHFFLQPLQLR
jgi:hypothetical protein